MKTLNTSTNRRLAAAMICGMLGLSCSAVSSAADDTEVAHAIVRFGDLNLSTSQGAVTLYGRITAAARKVCRSFDVDRNLASVARLKTCVDKSIAEAVVKVGQRELFAIYGAKIHQPPIVVAAVQYR
jgi:UrcA family protein